MRDIRFRGKRLDNGEWLYGDLQHHWDGLQCRISDYCGGNPVDPSTVGQFTGLYDSKRTEEYPKGQRIYEGDILRVGNPGRNDDGKEVLFDTSIHIVEWHGEKWDYPAFDLEPSLDCDCNSLSHIICAGDVVCEVIGNVTDNPELLKES